MDVDLAEVMLQESDAKVLNAIDRELETVAECLHVEEEDEDVNERDDDRRAEPDDGEKDTRDT